MTIIATTGLPVANSWQISVSGGWIVVMLIGMGLCFVGMLSFMWLMRDGRGWAMCGHRYPQDTARMFLEYRFAEGTVPVDEAHQREDVWGGTAVPRRGPAVSSPESEEVEPL